MGTKSIKVGDFVVCHYSNLTGIGYGKVLKMFDKKNKIGIQGHENVVTGWGDRNTLLDITVQMVGYDIDNQGNEDRLSDLIEITDGEIKVLDPHNVYRVLDEKMITEMKNEWERMMTLKLNFFYKHINKEPLEGRKSLNNLKLT